jgi:hypothetical protein
VPVISGPGADDLFDPWDLDDVRDRVVLPVVRSVLRPDELNGVEVGWGPGISPWNPDDPADELWVLVHTTDESSWSCQIWDPVGGEQTETHGEVAYLLADRLEDWVCEGFAWGEQRIAHAVIPTRAP